MGNWLGECDQREWETAALLQTGNKRETAETKREQKRSIWNIWKTTQVAIL